MIEMTKSEVNNSLLNMLDYIDRVLKENNLKYFLDGGTLLGAIRHKGFIPWDDDIDIILWRDDYEKLRTILKNQKSQYKLLSLEDADYPYTYYKLIDTKTFVQEKGAKKMSQYGLFLDIFPMDMAPQSTLKQKMFFSQSMLLRKISRGASETSEGQSFAKSIFIKLLSPINENKLAKRADIYFQKFNTKDSDFCFNLPGAINSKVFKTEWFDKSIDVEFEGLQLSAPAEFDEYLSCLYGDYMKLPNVEDRVTHQLKVYKLD